MNSGNGNGSDEAKILIVEDSLTQALLLKHLLERHGYEVTAAASGKEALDVLATQRPALIISDIVIPEMDGYELTSAIKQDIRLGDIPVILLTSLSDPDDVIRGLESRVDFYMIKPYDEDFLLSKVKSVIEHPMEVKKCETPQQLMLNLWGKPRMIAVDPENSLSLLASIYENTIQINNKLLQTQMELRALNHDLEGKVIERTSHLQAEIGQRKRAEQRVNQRTAELEMVNNELKEFAYVVSHDLKAPLRAVSQLANWIAADHADAMDDDGKEMITLLLSRLDRMHNLIEGILQYSRLGRVKEELMEVDLDQLVREVIDLIAPPDNIQVIIVKTLPRIKFEYTRAVQVFQNLITNGIKYMDKPQGEVKLDWQDAGTHWQFSVADNGPGIEEKYHEKIFQIFQTLTPRDEFESTGVGLTLVKKIVEMNGGRIWVESVVGQGTTFVFTLAKEKSPCEDEATP